MTVFVLPARHSGRGATTLTDEQRRAVLLLAAGSVFGAVMIGFGQFIARPKPSPVTDIEPPPLPIRKKKIVRKWKRRTV